jgi:predicted nucleotidyltransferase
MGACSSSNLKGMQPISLDKYNLPLLLFISIKNMNNYNKYKKYWDDEENKYYLFLEKCRIEALEEAERLKDILTKNFSVKKVVLIGSVLEKEKFKKNSDIDIAVLGLPKDKFFSALSMLMRKTSFMVDIKPIEEAEGHFLKIISRGRVLYEEGKNS